MNKLARCYAVMVVFTIAVVLYSFNAVAQQMQEPEPDQDRTLSPYFFVKSDDPSVDQLPLKHTGAEVNIAGVIADVKVTQVYKNEGKRPLEAVYIFPASTRAAVYAMKMTIGTRTIVAVIEKKEEARQHYEQAKAEGKSASLLEQQRPNVFQMNVANIMPGDEIKVEMAYTELLVPVGGIYEFIYPTVAGPRYTHKKEAGAAPSDKWVQNPYLHQGESAPYTFDIRVKLAAGVPVQEISCSSHKLDFKYESANDVLATLDPAEKKGGDRDFILKYRLAGGQVVSGLLLYPGTDENFFLLMVQPPKRIAKNQIPPREYIFVVDVSGSMYGFPLDISKQLLRDLIGNLRPSDRFNVVLFSGGFDTLGETSVPATSDNVQRAIAVIDNQRGGGGTEILPALQHALALPRSEGFARTVVIVTDGYVDVEPEVFDLIRGNLSTANVFAFGIGTSVNRHLIEGMAHVGMGEPFAITRPDEAPGKATQFREYIETPVLTQIRTDFGGFDVYAVEPPAVPDVLAERPVLVFGKWRGRPQGTITVQGLAGNGPYRVAIDASTVMPAESNRALRYLWARYRIALLGDYQNLRPGNETIKEITNLGLKYNLLTNYTSFVAIDSVVRNQDGKPEIVKQPLPLPQGVSDLAVGASEMEASRGRGIPPPAMQAMPSPSAKPLAEPSTSPLMPPPPASIRRIQKSAEAEQVLRHHAVIIQSVSVNGGSDRKAIEQAIRVKTYDIEWCVNTAYSKGTNPAGEIEIRIVFNPDGTVKEIHVDGPARPKGFDECLKQRLKTWIISSYATGGKPVEVALQLTFKR